MFSLSLATAAVATHDHYYYYIYWWASGPQPHHQPVDSFVYDELRESDTDPLLCTAACPAKMALNSNASHNMAKKKEDSYV